MNTMNFSCISTPALNSYPQIWDVVLVDNCSMMPENPSSPTSGLSNEASTGIPFLHTHSMKVMKQFSVTRTAL